MDSINKQLVIRLKDLILALSEETKTTFFICTHLTSFAQEVCNTIGIVNEGVLVEVGAPQRIMDAYGADDLQQAYIKIMDEKVDKTRLLDWRSE
ncbi:MAG: hypothetical protein ACFFFO_13730 [Candidatus Thorarchaeota archaeon]